MRQASLFLATIFLVSTAFAAGGGHGDSHDIPWTVIQTQAINLGILLVVLTFFIRTPLKNAFKAKKEAFLEESAKTAQALKQAEAELSDIKTKLATLEQGEASAIASAQKEAKSQADKMVGDTQAQAKKIVEDTNLIIAAEVVKAKNQIREKIISKSMAAAEQNIKGSSDSITKKSEAGFLQDLGQVKA